MKIKPLLVLFLIILALVAPAAAAETGNENLIKKAKNISAKVPPKGSAPLGSAQSMTEMIDWLNDCSESLLLLFTDIMDIFGISNAPYVQNLSKVLAYGTNQTPARAAK